MAKDFGSSVSEMGIYCKIPSREVWWSKLNFKRIPFWESLTTVLRIDYKRVSIEVGNQVIRLVQCEMIDMLSSEEWLDFRCIFQGWTDKIFWWGWIWGEKEGPRMTPKVFALGTLKIGIFIYQDEKTGGGTGWRWGRCKTCIFDYIKMNLRRHLVIKGY